MMFFGLFIGFVLQITHGNYVPVFLLAGSAYLIAIGIIQLLAPKLSVVAIDSPRSTLVSRSKDAFQQHHAPHANYLH